MQKKQTKIQLSPTYYKAALATLKSQKYLKNSGNNTRDGSSTMSLDSTTPDTFRFEQQKQQGMIKPFDITLLSRKSPTVRKINVRQNISLGLSDNIIKITDDNESAPDEKGYMSNLQTDYAKALEKLAKQRTTARSSYFKLSKRGQQKPIVNQSTLSSKTLQTINQRLESETIEVVKQNNLQYKNIKDDAHSLLIQKPKLSVKQKVQVKYYQTVLDLINKTVQLMNDKSNFNKIRVNMNSIIYVALVIQDPEVLKLAHQQFGYISIVMRQFTEAKKQFKYLKDVCEDTRDYTMKILAYKMLGTCYKHLYQYKISTNCYKKMLSLAWDIGDRQAEILAFEQLGMIYYYKGQLDKAKYYSERATRGWVENDQSQVKQLQKRVLQNQRVRNAYNYGVPNIKSVFEKFSDITFAINQWIHLELDKIASPIMEEQIEEISDSDEFYSDESIIPVEILDDTTDVYREFVLTNKNSMGLTPGSLVSNASVKTLPSPKGIKTNIESLPHFNEQVNLDILKS
ncbi:histidine acid phosphatase family protein [Stylonychia lemnae]|uniref:Histidine acid phosphatase family protein n=1 Tax=Stylonychia lemnae TaxID=5949 RepID=A0A078ATB9_STYLE|nr:histidine acid phosphatase family protein [Stylonychia lemnae]|eukprot:CDW85695.1 histidine acid phosphatase family protein [Stylonychia lemnae]